MSLGACVCLRVFLDNRTRNVIAESWGAASISIDNDNLFPKVVVPSYTPTSDVLVFVSRIVHLHQCLVLSDFVIFVCVVGEIQYLTVASISMGLCFILCFDKCFR